MSQAVSAKVLWQGAWYALEQAGRLLHSSVTLFEADDWSTATGIAMLGREELGRSRILRELAEKAGKGEALSRDDVQAACEDHVTKQRAAVLSTTMKAANGTGLGDLLQARMSENPQSEKWRDADAKLKVVTDKKTKRLPTDRHEMRMQCFYVDLKDNGDGWRRPCDVTRDQAQAFISDAMNDYAVQRDRLREEVIESDDPLMAAARREMNPPPSLSSPRWPY
jgi:AbiV family abortive infection protein